MSSRLIWTVMALNVLAFDSAATAQTISGPISVREHAEHPEGAPSPYLAGIMAAGDVNADGYDDLVVGIQSQQTDYPDVIFASKPILMVYDASSGRYNPSKEFQGVVDRQIWPRRAAIVDFDGNGYGDIYVAGHGTDGMDILHCGDQNILVQSGPDGFVNRTPSLPQMSDYSHGLVVGRINKDPVDDLLILNSPFVQKGTCPRGQKYTNSSYAMDGATIFSGDEIKLSGVGNAINGGSGGNFAHHGVAHDVNGDGLDDLIVGGDLKVTVLESSGPGRYKRAASLRPPEAYFKLFDTSRCLSENGRCFTPYSAIAAIDIDGDGSAEIAASLLNQRDDGGWQGQYLQILQRHDGQWVDVTENLIPSQTESQTQGGRWCNELYALDINADGRQDLLCSAIGERARAFWMNEGGVLVQSKRTEGLGFLTPVRLGNRVRLVGLQSIYSGSDRLEGFRVAFAQ